MFGIHRGLADPQLTQSPGLKARTLAMNQVKAPVLAAPGAPPTVSPGAVADCRELDP